MTVKTTFFCAVIFNFLYILCVTSGQTIEVGTPVTPPGDASDFFSIGDTVQLVCTIDPQGVTVFLTTWRVLGTTTGLVEPRIRIEANDPATDVVFNVIINDTSDPSNYECVGADINAISTNLLAVFTININPFFNVTPGANVLATNGSNPDLTCVADGFPIPDVRLVRIRDGVVLALGGSSVDVFPFPTIFGDEGDYQCIANTTGAVDAVFNFTATLSPEGSVEVDVGEVSNRQVQLNCTALGGPGNMFTWFREGIMISDGGNFQIMEGSSGGSMLIVSNLLSGTLDEYTCSVENAAGQQNVSVNISVPLQNVLTVTPLNLTVEIGSTAVFNCSNSGLLENEFFWLRNSSDPTNPPNVDLINPNDTNSPFVVTNGMTLTIMDVQPEDGGIYLCVSDNPLITEFGFAVLYVSPNVTQQPMEMFVEEGDSVVLTCFAEGFPTPTYTWEKMNMTTGIFEMLEGETESTLSFDPVQYSDFGRYRCVATIDVNKRSVSPFEDRSMEIILHVSPDRSAIVEPNVYIAEHGEDVNFTCSAQGGPNNMFFWVRNASDACVDCSGQGDIAQFLEDLAMANETFTILEEGYLLTISNISANADGGTYFCVVFNEAGYDVAMGTLYVTPRIIVEPEDIKTDVNEVVYFECIAESFPFPMYQWERFINGEAITQSGETNTQLLFDPVYYDDSGVYRCVVSAELDISTNTTVSRNATLYVSPNGSVQLTRYVFVEQGDEFNLTCTAQGGPNNYHQWTLDGTGVMETGVLSITSSSSDTESESILLVTSVDAATHQGIYTCNVSNMAGYEARTSRVVVSPFGIVSITPENLIVSRGDDDRFTCVTDAGPDTFYVWLFNASELVCEDSNCSSGSIAAFNVTDEELLNATIAMTPVLNLTDITAPENGGEYICIAVNDAGVGLSTSTLYVVPEFLEEPQDIKTDNGEVVYFTCLAESFPFPAYQWERLVNGQFEIVSGENGTVLLFSPVSYTDAGVYRCVVTNTINNTLNTIESQNATLFVSPINSVMLRPMVYVNQGDEFNLTCTAQGGPNNYHQWTLDGTGVMETGVLSITSSSSDTESESILLVTSVDAATHQGIYTCNVSNMAGYEARSSRVVVSPLGIVSTTPENVILSRGDNVTFTCQTDAGPDTIYLWFYNVSDLVCESSNCENGVVSNFNASDEDIMNAVLTMNPVLNLTNITAPENGGEYICIAVNDAGVGLSTSTLYVVPEFLEEPQDIKTDNGDVVYFTCLAESFPFPAYQWERLVNGQFEIVSGENGTVLQFNPVSYTDAGVYRCVVTNTINNTLNTIESQNATLFVSPINSVMLRPMVYVNQGDEFNLTCTAQGGPNNYHQWTLDGTGVMETGVLSITSSSSDTESESILLVTSVDAATHQGIYTCNVSNMAGYEARSSRVVVSPLGIVSTTPENVILSRGDNVTFTCQTDAGPDTIYLWFYNVSDLVCESSNCENGVVSNFNASDEDIMNAVLTMNPVLSLTNITAPENGGEYICIAVNDAGVGLSTSTLYVVPEFLEEPQDIKTDDGEVVYFTCLAESFPFPAYQWERLVNGQFEIVSGENGTVLLFSPVSYTDAGVYRCVVTNTINNTLNTIESQNATLFVSPINSVMLPPMVYVNQGDEFNLTCTAQGGPNNYHQWTLDGTGVMETGVLSITSSSSDTESQSILLVTSVDAATHQGIYTCNVSNMAGYEARSSRVVVSPLGIVSTTPENVILSRGDNVTFTCQTDAGPDTIYLWLYNVSDLVCESSNCENGVVSNFNASDEDIMNAVLTMNPVLNLTNITAPENGGEYICIAVNDAGVGLSTSQLNVLPEFVEQPLSINTTVPSSFNLTCLAESFPYPYYQWQKMNTGTLMFEDIEGENRTYLEFDPVDFSDFGMYRCVATNTINGEEYTNTSEAALITVSPQGSIMLSPQNMTFDYAMPAILTCTIQGGPDNSFYWFLNDTLIVPDGQSITIVNQPFSSILTIASISAPLHGGTYQCMASNAAGSDDTSTFLFVSPRFIQQPVQTLLTRNNAIEMLTCLAESFPDPQYQWFYVTDGSLVLEEPVLPFNPVMFGDEGIYQCVVSSNDLTIYSIQTTVHVSPLGSLQLTEEVINAEEGDDIVTICSALGGLNNSFQWTYLRTDEEITTSTELEIDNVTVLNGGCYECFVSNPAGFDSIVFTLNIGPLIVEQPEDFNVTRGNSFMLNCTATGFPIPYITWRHNDTDIDVESDPRIQIYTLPFESQSGCPGSGSGSESEIGSGSGMDDNFGMVTSLLMVENTVFTDSGDYQCVSNNLDVYNDTESEIVRVLVQDVPDIPVNLDANNVTSRNLTLLWTAPHDNNAPILGYRVFYTNPSFIQGGTEVILMTVNGRVEELFIEDLHPGVKYYFTVLAFNEEGSSNRSEPFNITTSEEAPGGPPTEPDAFALSPTEIFVTWQPPIEEDRHGFIVSYDILYTALDENGMPIPDMTFIIERFTDGFEIILDDLMEYTNYSIYIRASTEVGPGPFSDEMIVTLTDETFPDTPILNDPIDETGSTTAIIRWSPPTDPNGEITSYTIEAIPVQFREDPYPETDRRRQIEEDVLTCIELSNFTDLILITVGGNTLAVTLTGLIPFTVYEVRVAASTVVGRGNFSDVVTFTTAVDNPAPILDLQGAAQNETSIMLSWEGPPCPNGVINGYYIYYTIIEIIQPQPIDSNGFLEERLISNERYVTYSLTDLRPGENYAIHVRAFTIDDNGTELMGMADTEILVMLNRFIFVPSPNTGVDDTSFRLPSASDFGDIGIDNITYYGVIVVPDPDMDFNPEVDNFNSVYPNVQPYESREGNRYYITAAWNDVTDVPDRFTAGDESTTMAMRSDVNETYFNAELDRFTPHCYYVVVHHISSIGDEVVIRYFELTCRDTRLGYNLIALIVSLILAFLILCCLLIFIILCCCCWCRRRRSKYPVSQKEEVYSQPKQPEIVILNPYIPTDSNREPIHVEDYAAYVARMHSNQDYLFTEEYSEIEPEHHPTRNASTANKEKDRYLNIPAYDHSRVLLKHCSSGSNYINANYIGGYGKSGNFIATQGPMPSTTSDFWCMVFEQNVPIIVMLTNLEERGRVKCHKYWPNSPYEGENTVDYGQIHVELLEETKQQNQTIRTLSLSMAGSEARTVQQYHFTSWPDHGVPAKYHELLDFLQTIMSVYNPVDGPIVVHCSAGVGRTGAFIGLSVEMARATKEKTVDIYNYVQYMRKQRPSMVLNETEYIFIHDALLEAMKLGMIEGVSAPKYEDGKQLEETSSHDSVPIEYESSFGHHEKESEILGFHQGEEETST